MREYRVHWAALVGVVTGFCIEVGYMGRGRQDSSLQSSECDLT